MNRSPSQRDNEQWRQRDDEKRRHRDDEQRRYRDDEQRRHRDDEQRAHGDVQRGYRDDVQRGYRDDVQRGYRDDVQRGNRDDEHSRHRDDEHRRHRDDKQRIHRDDEQRIHRDEEQRIHRDEEQKRHRDEEQKRHRCDHELTDSQSNKRHKDSMPTSSNTIDKMYEMFKSFPPQSPTSTKCLGDKNRICNQGRTWAERMDAEAKPKNVTNNANEPDDVNKENNPWKKYIGKERETDKKKLQNRQRQIDIGKETGGYVKYTKEVNMRDRSVHHPRTPDKFTVCSTRSWQGVVRVWRRKLHHWDPPEVAKEHQLKFANILASPFDNEEEDKEKETTQDCQSDNSIENEDGASEGGQNSLKGNSLHCDENVMESMLFWNEI